MRRHDEMGRDDGGGNHGGDHGGNEWVERREGPSARFIVLGIVVVLIVLFVLQNTDEVKLDFLFLDGVFPLWTMLLVMAVLGFVGGWYVGRIRGAERRARRAERRKD